MSIRNKALDRLIYQYKKAPKTVGYIDALLNETDGIEQVFTDLLNKRLNIDVAEGEQLDKIGQIVGQTRPLTSTLESTESGELMSDEKYRALLKATIFKNSSGNDIDSISQYGRFVFNSTFNITESIGAISVTATTELEQWQIDIIKNTLPVAAGIRVDVSSAGGENPFSFAGFAFGSGFGSVEVEQFGGGFVGII